MYFDKMRRYFWCCCPPKSAKVEGDELPLGGNSSDPTVSSFVGSNGSRNLEFGGKIQSSSKEADAISFANSNVEEAVSDTSSVYTKDQKQPPRIDWVIGLDFGTTYSGFAYARAVSGAVTTHVYYDWPRKRTERAYCKTLTGIFYKRSEVEQALECSSWGYPARSDYADQRDNRRDANREGSTRGMYFTKFKLLLNRGVNDLALAASIPAPLTATSIITDYLRLIGKHALDAVENHHMGDHKFSQDSVQWVVTVPSIWDENAKQQMKACMVNAGLISAEAGGIDAVKVVLEPEAASFHCHEILRQERREVFLNTDDKILVADVGGGTVDIVVQEMIGSSQTYMVQELTESSGGLCGGIFVDDSFMRFLSQKIPCLDEFLRRDYPSYRARLLRDWEEIKCAFGYEMMSDGDTKDINIHPKLAMKWEAYEAERGNILEDSSVVELKQQDLKSIFDPVVEDILTLIAAQLAQVPDIKVMFVVGGFASSPYLMQRIRARFAGDVAHIVSPPNPGSAIVQGAVSLALHPDAIVSRIAKRTYGTSVILPFEHGVDPPELLKVTNGKEFCRSRFDVFVRKGDRVEVNTCVTKDYMPHEDNQKQMLFDLHSSSERDPRYTEGESAEKEGDFAVSLPQNYSAGGEVPRFDLSMFFGRANIELRAVGKRGGSDGRKACSMVLPVKFCS